MDHPLPPVINPSEYNQQLYQAPNINEANRLPMTIPLSFSAARLENGTIQMYQGPSPYLMPSGRTIHQIIQESDYEVIKRMGLGTINLTLLVRIDGKEYVLRRLHKRDAMKKAREDWFRETMVYAALAPSPYIMPLLAVDFHQKNENNTQGIAVMLFEPVPGRTLEEWLHESKTNEEIDRVRQGLLNGLNDLHSKNIYHYDIHPGNIYIPYNSEKPPIYLDFGASFRWDPSNRNEANYYKAFNETYLYNSIRHFNSSNQVKKSSKNSIKRLSQLTKNRNQRRATKRASQHHGGTRRKK